MGIKLNREKAGVVLLSALVIAMLLVLPRVVIVLFIKYNRSGDTFNIKAGGSGLLLKLLYNYCMAVAFLWINTLREKFIIKPVTIDFSRFYIRVIVNVLLFFVTWLVTARFGLHTPALAVTERFYDFISSITIVLEVILCVLVAEVYMLMASNQEMRLRNKALQKANVEATFEVLKHQVNPHFLFNSLNTINAMIGNNNDAARAFVNNMSVVYRHVLGSVNKPVVMLKEEMEIAMAYLEMLRERYRGNLEVEVISDPGLMQHLLPPMSIQILLENAVKHSVISAKQPLLIRIEVKEKLVIVCNALQERKVKPASTGIGLYNLNQRYWYLCKKEIAIAKTDSIFKVSLPLLQNRDTCMY